MKIDSILRFLLQTSVTSRNRITCFLKKFTEFLGDFYFLLLVCLFFKDSIPAVLSIDPVWCDARLGRVMLPVDGLLKRLKT